MIVLNYFPVIDYYKCNDTLVERCEVAGIHLNVPTLKSCPIVNVGIHALPMISVTGGRPQSPISDL